jgi:curved DNA-binding protein CbpA
MGEEDKRNFKRYKSQSECEIRINSETYKGRVLDYSDGIGALIEYTPQLTKGVQVDIRILDSDIEFKGEVVWTKEVGNYLRVGFKRIDTLKGSLKDFKLSDILIGLQRGTKTGILEIRSGSIIKKIFVKNGDMIFAASNQEDDRLGELLLKEGKITLEDYDRASFLVKKTGQRLGKILVDLGCLTPKELFWAVRHQIEEIILSLFTITEGSFEFQEGPLPTEEMITLQISAANIIYNGIKRINNFVYIKQMCPPLDAILNLSPNPLNIFQSLTLEEPDKKILSYVNGMYSLKTILSLSLSTDFETLKTICALLSIGLIKVKEKDEAPVELPIEEILGEPEEEAPKEFLEKIESMYKSCETLGYYEILGVGKDASVEEIKKAYYKVSKQFHPDRHFSFPSHDIKGKLTKILLYTTEAYETLSDPEKRSEYDRMPSLKAEEKPEPVEIPEEPIPAPSKEEVETEEKVPVYDLDAEEHKEEAEKSVVSPLEVSPVAEEIEEPAIKEPEPLIDIPEEEIEPEEKVPVYDLDAEEHKEEAEKPIVSPLEEVEEPTIKKPEPMEMPEEPTTPPEEEVEKEKEPEKIKIEEEKLPEQHLDAEREKVEERQPIEVPMHREKEVEPVDVKEQEGVETEEISLIPEGQDTQVEEEETIHAMEKTTEERKDVTEEPQPEMEPALAGHPATSERRWSKRVLFFIPLIILIVLGISFLIYENVRLPSREPVYKVVHMRSLPSFRDEAFKILSRGVTPQKRILPSFHDEAFKRLGKF